jgi:hydroxypyruvate isomerase
MHKPMSRRSAIGRVAGTAGLLGASGGVPDRHEIDDTQELCYPAIMRAIVETGFTGYVAQEFVPRSPDPLASLKQGILICDV